MLPGRRARLHVTSYTFFDQASFSDENGAGTSNTTCGIVFTVTGDCQLGAFWWWSRSLASELPSECAIWDADTAEMVPGTDLIPSWSGAVGTAWVRAPYGSPVTLSPGTSYVASCYLPPASSPSYGEQSGNPEITSGPLLATGTWGRIVHASGISLPTTVIAIDFGVDIEVSVSSPSGGTTPLVMASIV